MKIDELKEKGYVSLDDFVTDGCILTAMGSQSVNGFTCGGDFVHAISPNIYASLATRIYVGAASEREF